MGFLEQPSSDTPAAASFQTQSTQSGAHDSTAPQPPATSDAPAQPEDAINVPPLEAIISAPDFAHVAEKALTPKAWAFYSSAATDLVTHTRNKELLKRIMIRPRVLKDVRNVSMERTILGFKCKAPFFISPAAMARLAHPDGELALSRAAANEGIIQTVCYPIPSFKSGKPTDAALDLKQCYFHPAFHYKRCAAQLPRLFPVIRQLRPSKDD